MTQLSITEDSFAVFSSRCLPLLSNSTYIQARFTTGYVYMDAMLFNIIFRAFFVLYPDYGLVKDGRPALRLVHQLYWVVLSSFILVNHTVLPLSFLIKGTFPEGTGPGRLCLGLGGQQTQDSTKVTIMQFMTPLLAAIVNCYVCWMVRRFIRGHCPGGRLSCIGVYRRNVISLKETSGLLYTLCLSSFIDSVIQAIFPNRGENLQGKILFWVWNIKGISFNEGLFLILPIFFDIPIESEASKVKRPFYVRAPPKLLLPRPPNPAFRLPSPSSPVLPTTKPSSTGSSSSTMKTYGIEDKNRTSKQSGFILFVKPASPSSPSSPSFQTCSEPVSISERKSISMRKDALADHIERSGKSDNKQMLSIQTNKPKLLLSIPTNKPHDEFCKRYRTMFYCKQHNQIERFESQP